MAASRRSASTAPVAAARGEEEPAAEWSLRGTSGVADGGSGPRGRDSGRAGGMGRASAIRSPAAPSGSVAGPPAAVGGGAGWLPRRQRRVAAVVGGCR